MTDRYGNRIDRELPELSEREYYKLKAREADEAAWSPAERSLRDQHKSVREKITHARRQVQSVSSTDSAQSQHLLAALDKLDTGCEGYFAARLKLTQRLHELGSVAALTARIERLDPVKESEQIAVLENELAEVNVASERLKTLGVQSARAATSLDEFIVTLATADAVEDDRRESFDRSIEQLDAIVERTLRYFKT